MAAPKTVKTYPLNGTQKDFPISFEYLARKFVVVTLIGTTRRELVLNTDYRFTTATQVTTTVAWGAGQGYEFIEIRRITSATDRLVDFADGSILRAYDLNISSIQSLHIAEEARDLTADTIAVNNDGNLDARAKRIVNLADGIDPGDAVTMRQEASWATSTYNNMIASGASATASEDSRQASVAKAGESAASATASQASRVASESARDAANSASSLAQKWASELEDVVVAGGKFSAFHWSLKATAQAASATAKAGESAASATASQASRVASESARDAAQTAEANAASWAASVNMPSMAGKALQFLRANAGATGLEYVAIPDRAYAGLTIQSTHTNPGASGTENIRWDLGVASGVTNSSGTGVVNLTKAGKYRFTFNGVVSAIAPNGARLRLYKSEGSGFVAQSQTYGKPGAGVSICAILNCGAGAAITVVVDRATDTGYLVNSGPSDLFGSLVIERIDN